jgi:zinc protease
MRKTTLTLAFVCATFTAVPSVWAKPPVVPETAPLGIKVPDFDVRTLSCGMKVLFLKDDGLPLVSARLLIPGGSVADPDGKEGLVSLMNSTLRNGGAGDLTPETFDSALEDMATSMSAGADSESFSSEFKCLSGDLEKVLGLFADMVRRPKFDVKRLESNKADLLDSANRLEDTPDALTRVLFYRSLFGHSPYGRWASPRSLAAIGRSDVDGFYRSHYGPRGAVLSVTGKFDEEKVLAQLEKLFGDWKAQPERQAYEDAKPLGPTIYFFPKEVSQVFIRYGALGIKRHDPRDVPIQVSNYILGGSGFTCRLMRQIRSDRGLAYFVDSVVMPYNVRGVFEVIGGTRPDSVKEYLTVMFQVLSDFAKEGPTDEELQQAQRSIVEEYAYNFDSSFTTAGYELSLDFNGYPADYLKTYRDRVRSVTRKQATSAMADILSQKDWVLVVAGPAGLEKELSAFGNVVTVKDIFGPLSSKP